MSYAKNSCMRLDGYYYLFFESLIEKIGFFDVIFNSITYKHYHHKYDFQELLLLMAFKCLYIALTSRNKAEIEAAKGLQKYL